ncbi:MAG: hypothetical protein KDD52_10250, partial [Bdellovibrionales bacterium]|nr:hypothetical protein [Bdellovibrionales bacterium]
EATEKRKIKAINTANPTDFNDSFIRLSPWVADDSPVLDSDERNSGELDEGPKNCLPYTA